VNWPPPIRLAVYIVVPYDRQIAADHTEIAPRKALSGIRLAQSAKAAWHNLAARKGWAVAEIQDQGCRYAPRAKIRKVEIHGAAPPTGFQCQLLKAGMAVPAPLFNWTTCVSPTAAATLPDGSYAFSVRSQGDTLAQISQITEWQPGMHYGSTDMRSWGSIQDCSSGDMRPCDSWRIAAPQGSQLRTHARSWWIPLLQLR
jgi:hypothetical protein